MVKRTIASIKTFQVTLLALSCLTVFLFIQNAEGFLIQDGSKDMDEVTAIAQDCLEKLRRGPGTWKGIIVCYCRTGQLVPQQKYFWVVGVPYGDDQQKSEVMFNLRVSIRNDFGCLDNPVTINIRRGDSSVRLPR